MCPGWIYAGNISIVSLIRWPTCNSPSHSILRKHHHQFAPSSWLKNISPSLFSASRRTMAASSEANSMDISSETKSFKDTFPNAQLPGTARWKELTDRWMTNTTLTPADHGKPLLNIPIGTITNGRIWAKVWTAWLHTGSSYKLPKSVTLEGEPYRVLTTVPMSAIF